MRRHGLLSLLAVATEPERQAGLRDGLRKKYGAPFRTKDGLKDRKDEIVVTFD